MAGLIKSIAKKVTLELIYDAVDERTKEIKEEMKEMKEETKEVRNEIRAMNARFDQINSQMNSRFDQLFQMWATHIERHGK